jgi:hypothetical protein
VLRFAGRFAQALQDIEQGICFEGNGALYGFSVLLV